MRILVTGGGGFLGTSIIHELLKNPSCMVTNFSRHSYAHLEEMAVPTIRGDLTKPKDIERALAFGFDAIFHVAGLSGTWGPKEEFFETNYVGTKNLLEAAKKFGVTRFVFTSSADVVFTKEEVSGGGEELPYASEFYTSFAETKMLAEKLVLEMNDSSTFLTCALRPGRIWGPGDRSFFPRIVQLGKAGKLRVIGDGETLVDLIFVKNAARAHVEAFSHLHAGSRVCGSAYFIGQERPVRLWDFINRIFAEYKIEPIQSTMTVASAYRLGWFLEKLYGLLGIRKPGPPASRYEALALGITHTYSHEKARRDFGHVPLISVEEGLAMTFSSRDLYKRIEEKNRAK